MSQRTDGNTTYDQSTRVTPAWSSSPNDIEHLVRDQAKVTVLRHLATFVEHTEWATAFAPLHLSM